MGGTKCSIAGITVLAVLGTLTPIPASSGPRLDDRTAEALVLAIQDEYKARAFYQAVIDEFGKVKPFSNVVLAESRHIEELLPLFEKYGVEVPDDTYSGTAKAPKSLTEACEQAQKAEIDNAAMYAEFFDFVEEKDIVQTFERLATASTDRHLPAFERCSGKGGGKEKAGPGCGGCNGKGGCQGKGAGKGKAANQESGKKCDQAKAGCARRCGGH